MIKRRGVLIGAGALASIAATRPQRANADTPEDAATELATVLANTLTLFAGTIETNADPAVATKLAAIERSARTRLTAMDQAGVNQLFSGVGDLGVSDANLNTSFSYLYDIALATRAPRPATRPSDLQGNTAVQDRVLDGLQWLYDNYFGDQSRGYYGNWFNWEIGIPRSATNTLALLYDRVRSTRPELITSYLEAFDGYLRNGKDGDVDLDSRFHTGANLADITTNRIVQGAISGDHARVAKAVADQLTVYATVDPYRLQHGVRDGNYADGSFIQHESVAYTGSYGRTLLTRVTQTLDILAGTSFAGTSDLVDTVLRWVTDGFAPLIFEGWMMEIVKGRAVSRTGTGYADVSTVIEAVVALAARAGTEDAAALRSYLKYLAGTSATPPAAESLTSPTRIVGYAQILADNSIQPRDLNPDARSVAYNAMDRTVHRRPSYAFAVSRSSERISKYEYMSGENLLSWFQGDGAHYLYLAGQDQRTAYGVDYFSCVSPYRLSGVSSPVQERRTIPELYGLNWYDNPDHPLGFTSSSQSQNTYVYFPRALNAWSGGATLGAYGLAGMVRSDDVAFRDKQTGILPEDFVVYRNARSTTSWLMLDDEIVVLTAGISDQDNRDVITTLDSRIAGVADAVEVTGELTDGTAWSGAGQVSDLSWLRYANADTGAAVGYLVLDGNAVTVDHQTVSGNYRKIRLTNPDTAVTRQLFNLSVTHRGESAEPGSIAYALVPNATADALRRYHRGRPPIELLANTERMQAVRHHGLGLTALNSFATGRQRIGWAEVDGPASVIIRRHSHELSIAISDPVFTSDQIAVTLKLPRLRPVRLDDGVTVHRRGPASRIVADTHQAYGRSFTATFRL
jgi:hyaluronate lyase